MDFEIDEYIKTNNLSFAEWLTDKSIDMDYVFKWLDKWDKIPSIAYTTISSRRDAMVFHRYQRICENPKEFFRFIKYQMHSRYDVSAHFPIIQHRMEEDVVFSEQFEKWVDSIKKKNMNDFYNMEFYGNFLLLLAHLDKRSEFFYFYNRIIFKQVYSQSENEKSNINQLVKKTYFYVVNQLERGYFQVDNIDILEGILDVLMNVDIQLYDTGLFMKILNEHKNEINIYKKEKLLSYLFMCFVEYEGISQDLLEMNREHMYEIYEKTIEIDTKLILLQFFVFMDKVAPEEGPFYLPKFFYRFLKEFNVLMDDYFRNVGIIDYFLKRDNRQLVDEEMYVLLNAKQHILYSNGYLEVLEKILELEKLNGSKMLMRCDIRKYLCNMLIVHFEVFGRNMEKYKNVQEYVEEHNTDKYLGVFEKFYNYYGTCEMAEEIIDDMNKEQYELFMRHVNRQESYIRTNELKMYKNVKKRFIDYPLEFIDAISMEPLRNFIEMPDSKILLNVETIQIHLYGSNVDPFTRKQISMERIDEYNRQPEVKERIQNMKKKIEEFLSDHK
jgi:hypothetical protein